MMPTVAALAAGWLAGGPVEEAGAVTWPVGRHMTTGRSVSPHWRRTRRSLARHLSDALGDADVDELGPADLWIIQSLCEDRGLSAETTNKITHHLLPALLRDAEAAGLIAAGTRERVMHGARKVAANPEPVGQALSLEDRDAVLAACRGRWYAPLVAFLFFTGVRIGEACAIRQRDIDWHRRTVRIGHSRRLREVSGGKNRGARRVLPLASAALAAISRLRNDDAPDEYLFRSPDGHPLNADNFRARQWPKIIARSGVRAFRIHDTRHTFATLALEAGVPLAKVAAYLGDRLHTVESRYSHVIPTHDWDSAVSAPTLRRAKEALA